MHTLRGRVRQAASLGLVREVRRGAWYYRVSERCRQPKAPFSAPHLQLTLPMALLDRSRARPSARRSTARASPTAPTPSGAAVRLPRAFLGSVTPPLPANRHRSSCEAASHAPPHPSRRPVTLASGLASGLASLCTPPSLVELLKVDQGALRSSRAFSCPSVRGRRRARRSGDSTWGDVGVVVPAQRTGARGM